MSKNPTRLTAEQLAKDLLDEGVTPLPSDPTPTEGEQDTAPAPDAPSDPTPTEVRHVYVVVGYRGRRTNEEYIEPGSYLEDDPRLHGLAEFLVDSKRAFWVPNA